MKDMQTLVDELNLYRDAYYNWSESLVTDKEYDDLYDQLEKLEKETGIVLSGSPTHSVGYEVKSELRKVQHSHPMLSLSKTKDLNDVLQFFGDRRGLMMLKMDGLTISLEYQNGKLIKAETRGNGEVGEDVLHNAKVFRNIPLTLPDNGNYVIDGEAIITYDDFQRINAGLPEEDRYKNPRNLVSGSVRQLDSRVAAERGIKFVAWKMAKGNPTNSFYSGLMRMKELGFTVVPAILISEYGQTVNKLSDKVEAMKIIAGENSYPIDGVVFGFDDIAYGESLGMTGHHPRNQIAFKFYDEEVETELIDVEWTVGKTGVIVPTAVFSPVELEGTVVERASLHNVGIFKQLKLSVGNTVTVYKANQIIPQIRTNLTAGIGKGKKLLVPDRCPLCGEETAVTISKDSSQVLICTNSLCSGKQLGKLIHFVSRDAMNIDGLSEATLKLFYDKMWVRNFSDLYDMKKYKYTMISLNGFGEKKVEKLFKSIEKSKHVKMENFINALCIPMIGISQAKIIAKSCNGDLEEFTRRMEEKYNWTALEGFGMVLSRNINRWYEKNKDEYEQLLCYITVEKPKENNSSDVFAGKTFVITGSLSHYANRDELKKEIEELGGKVSGSVSSKTDYLINNDVNSTSGKNKKAKELGVEIISEETYLSIK